MQTWNLLGLLAGGLMICAVGVADDFGLLRGRHKLMGQLAAALVVVAFGVRVDRVALFGWQIDLGLTAVPFTLFFLLGAINSLNLLDGMDGLLSSVGLVLCLALGAMALLGGHMTAAWVALALAGALAGFLFYNFPPASVFLGDSGEYAHRPDRRGAGDPEFAQGSGHRGAGGPGGAADAADLRHLGGHPKAEADREEHLLHGSRPPAPLPPAARAEGSHDPAAGGRVGGRDDGGGVGECRVQQRMAGLG